MAGLVNYYTSSILSARYKPVASVVNNITVTSGGQEVSISILNHLSTSAIFSIKYTSTI